MSVYDYLHSLRDPALASVRYIMYAINTMGNRDFLPNEKTPCTETIFYTTRYKLYYT